MGGAASLRTHYDGTTLRRLAKASDDANQSRLRADDGTGTHALRDLAEVRGFLSGPAVHTLFDAPWAMLFLAVLWLLHPWYGIFAMASMTVLLSSPQPETR